MDGWHSQLFKSTMAVYELLHADVSRIQLLQLSRIEEQSPRPTPTLTVVDSGLICGVVTDVCGSHFSCHELITSSKSLSKVFESMHCWTSPSHNKYVEKRSCVQTQAISSCWSVKLPHFANWLFALSQFGNAAISPMHRSGEMDICAGKRGARCARMVIAINRKDIT